MTDVFRLALAEESDTNVRNKVHEKNVIFKHIEHLTFALTDRSLTDQKRLFLESIIVTMLRVVASLIASHRCDDMGSSLPVVSAERQAFRTDLGRTQLQLSASGGLSVAINLFRHERELVMKTAFMVFISLQENSPVEVQDAVFEAVRAGSAGPAFLRIQEELHRTLAVVSDNISHAEAKESAEKAKKNSAKAYLKKRSLLSLESSGAHMDAVEEFVAEHFGDYFEDKDADLKKQVSLSCRRNFWCVKIVFPLANCASVSCCFCIRTSAVASFANLFTFIHALRVLSCFLISESIIFPALSNISLF